jgi:putative tricarboxylic transport membrane protein
MRFNDAVIGIFIVIFGLVIVIHVQSYPDMGDGMPGPSLFPTVIGVLLMITGAVQIPKGLRSGASLVSLLPEFNAHGIGNILSVIIASLFYIYASDFLGILLTSFCIMFGMMQVLKAKVVISAVVSIGATLCIYVIFNKCLMVPLPLGIFSF